MHRSGLTRSQNFDLLRKIRRETPGSRQVSRENRCLTLSKGFHPGHLKHPSHQTELIPLEPHCRPHPQSPAHSDPMLKPLGWQRPLSETALWTRDRVKASETQMSPGVRSCLSRAGNLVQMLLSLVLQRDTEWQLGTEGVLSPPCPPCGLC